MQFGEYERTIDQKGRLSLPAHLLRSRESDWQQVMIVKGESDCLYLYDVDTWQAVLDEAYKTMEDDEVRLFMHRTMADAQLSDIDNLHRVTISAALLRYAGIEKRAIIVGMFNRLELWDPDTWSAYLDGMEDVELPTIADLSRARIREVS